jgi:hypothetical protein
LQEQLAAAAAAISYGGGAALSAEQRSLLQVATADGLKLLQLGRSAVVLALTDTHRLLQGARESVKQQLQQSAGSSIIKAPAKHRQLLQQLKKCLQPAAQKAWYFVVWSNQQAPLAYQCLCQELAAEVQGQQAMAQQPTGVSLTGRPASSLPRVEPVPQQPVVVLAQAAAGSVSQASAATNLYELD